MRIAFYLTWGLDSDRPSGDRTIARLVVAALEAQSHAVLVASNFQPQRFWRSRRQVAAWLREVRSAKRRAREFGAEIWLTECINRRVPDAIGPLVSLSLGIPYVVYDALGVPTFRRLRTRHKPSRQIFADVPGYVAHRFDLAICSSDCSSLRAARGCLRQWRDTGGCEKWRDRLSRAPSRPDRV